MIGLCQHSQADIATAGIMTSMLTLLVVMKPENPTNVEATGVHYHQ